MTKWMMQRPWMTFCSADDALPALSLGGAVVTDGPSEVVHRCARCGQVMARCYLSDAKARVLAGDHARVCSGPPPLAMGDEVRWQLRIRWVGGTLRGIRIYAGRVVGYEITARRSAGWGTRQILPGEEISLSTEGSVLRLPLHPEHERMTAGDPRENDARLVDGLAADECLERYERYQREDLSLIVRRDGDLWGPDLTPAQLSCARELWRARLRALREAAEERDRARMTSVVVDDGEGSSR